MVIRLIIFLSVFIISCTNNNQQSVDNSTSACQSILPDTSRGWLARSEYDSYVHHREVSRQLGLHDIESSKDSIELRLWWEGAIYSPKMVWIITAKNDSLSFQRIDYYPNFEAGTIDSFQLINLKPDSLNPIAFFNALNLEVFWDIPMYYESGHSSGCVDGEVVSIELKTPQKYKTVSYPCYTLYKDSTQYQPFTRLVESITTLKETK
jgi:hypothetical protein